MPFFVIKGTYHIEGYEPDGDSIRFQADNPALWSRLSGPPVKLNAKQHAQLRLEAIDTLETHYAGFHQPLAYADGATDFLLHALGFQQVERGLNFAGVRVVTRAAEGVRGYILTRATEAYRRVVAFAFAGEAPEVDGSPVYLDNERLRDSANYKSLEAGFAYPTYYQGLFFDLRETFTEAVEAARAANVGFWPVDKTTTGFEVESLAQLSESVVILPKLFRRLVTYMRGGGEFSAEFKEFLAREPDPVLLLGLCRFTNLDTFIEVESKNLKLVVGPEELVFIPK